MLSSRVVLIISTRVPGKMKPATWDSAMTLTERARISWGSCTSRANWSLFRTSSRVTMASSLSGLLSRLSFSSLESWAAFLTHPGAVPSP